MRCVLNASLYKRNMFLTLTYDETKKDYHNILCYEDIQKFKKKLRRHCDYHHKKKVEIFNVHEYGKNGKKHWHLIVFNHDFDDKKIYSVKNNIPLYTSELLEKMWSHGFVTIGDVSEASALYQAQYMQKDIKNGNVATPRASKSNHSGIGKSYFLRHYEQILSLGYVPFNGRKCPIPRYFEKLAHKHWCHFNDQSYFHELIDRKRVYSPFQPGEPNKRISDLFDRYIVEKKERIEEKETEWRGTVEEHIRTGVQPEFVRSLKNKSYDMKNKNQKEKF